MGEVEAARVEPPSEYTQPWEKEEAPVPPRSTASVPVHDGVKVCVSPEEVIVRRMLVSDDVASVCDAPVWKVEY